MPPEQAPLPAVPNTLLIVAQPIEPDNNVAASIAMLKNLMVMYFFISN